MIFSTFLLLFTLFFVGFLFHLLLFYLILLGLFGSYLKEILIKKININDFSWFKLYKIFILYLFFLLFSYLIYYTNNLLIKVNLDGTIIKVIGDFIYKIFTNFVFGFGFVSAFVVGSRLAATFLSHLSVLGKIGTTIGAGVSSSFQIVNVGTDILAKFKAEMIDNTYNVHINDVKLINEIPLNKTDEILQSTLNLFKYKIDLTKYDNILMKEEGKSNIIEMIEKSNNSNLKEMGSNNNQNIDQNIIDFDVFINSPVENDGLNSELLNQIITILSYNLRINLFIVYLICMLIIIFTVKFVINTDKFLDLIKRLPLGKYIYYILSKLINIWKNSTIV